MSVNEFDEPGSTYETDALPFEVADAGPLGQLPRLALRQVRLESRLARLSTGEGVGSAISWLTDSLGLAVEVGPPEVVWRASGLRRSGMVAQLTWPRLGTRLAVGLETPVAHAVVDRLLGFDRLPPEGRLPLSPVEWGVLTFAVAETLSRLTEVQDGPFGVYDLTVERVGPDPFDVIGLGRVVTVRWPVRLGPAEGSIRLWLSEGLVARWLSAESPRAPEPSPELTSRLAKLSATWRAEAGTISLPRGLRTLRAGGVLPLINSTLSGTPDSPAGKVELTLILSGHGGRFTLAAEPVPHSGGSRLKLTAPPRHEPNPREAIPMNPPSTPAHSEPAVDVPVTLTVELGRVSLTLGRLADLRPGDVVELGRHSREPVELTSGGRLVARGELVQIDTELGVRVTQVFL